MPMRRCKEYGYLLSLTTPLWPLASTWLGRLTGAPDASAWLTVAWMFALVPLLDQAIGPDRHNPSGAEARRLSAARFYRALLALCIPATIATVAGGAWFFVHGGLGNAGRTGWVLSIGLVNAVLAINAAHELIHKRSRHERLAGGLLLALVAYASFKVEHLRGHHVHVATRADNSTARLGESVYRFLGRAVRRNFLSAWRLEAQRLRRIGRPALHWRNELIWWYLGSGAVATALWWWLGPWGAAFFALQALVAIGALEVVNYLEHYGLERERFADGTYERTTHRHSWNSDYLLTNLLLFQLQRHSDHHENPTRPYQLLRRYDDSPQLPGGYATMMVLAMIPPLWRRVMDPRVASLRAAGARNA